MCDRVNHLGEVVPRRRRAHAADIDVAIVDATEVDRARSGGVLDEHGSFRRGGCARALNECLIRIA